jgi:hypothetical protein
MGDEKNAHGTFTDDKDTKYATLKFKTGEQKIDSIELAVERLHMNFELKKCHGFLNKKGDLIYLTLWGFLPENYRSLDFYKENDLDSSIENIEMALLDIFAPFIEDVNNFNVIDIDETIKGVFLFLVLNPKFNKENFRSIEFGLSNTGFEFDYGQSMSFSEER